jgi:hypothetical protein
VIAFQPSKKMKTAHQYHLGSPGRGGVADGLIGCCGWGGGDGSVTRMPPLVRDPGDGR